MLFLGIKWWFRIWIVPFFQKETFPPFCCDCYIDLGIFKQHLTHNRKWIIFRVRSSAGTTELVKHVPRCSTIFWEKLPFQRGKNCASPKKSHSAVPVHHDQIMIMNFAFYNLHYPFTMHFWTISQAHFLAMVKDYKYI